LIALKASVTFIADRRALATFPSGLQLGDALFGQAPLPENIIAADE
jgi:hypothetical protein